jgi:CBS domain-containing protein
MIIADIMTPHPQTCRVDETLDRVARLMWDYDCGALPIVDRGGHVVGMVTDRDICMAAYFQGRPLHQILVTVAGSTSVHSVAPDAPVAAAYRIMKTHRVRRLPVIDFGGCLVGMLSLGDIVRRAWKTHGVDDDLDFERVASMLAEVYRPGAPTLHVAAEPALEQGRTR